jgi:hypothetical protein
MRCVLVHAASCSSTLCMAQRQWQQQLCLFTFGLAASSASCVAVFALTQPANSLLHTAGLQTVFLHRLAGGCRRVFRWRRGVILCTG